MEEKWKEVPGYEGLYEISDIGRVRSIRDRVKFLKNTKTSNSYEIIGLFRDGKQKRFMVHRLVWEAFNGEIPDGLQIDHINTVRDDNRLINLRMVTPKENSNNPITLARLRETNQRKFQDPKWLEAVREGVKRRSQDAKWLDANREAVKRRSDNPKWLEAVREKNRCLCQDPQWREAVREANRKVLNKPVLQLDKETDEIIRRWDCAMDAYRDIGINNRNISACCRGKLKSAGGYRWRFAE